MISRITSMSHLPEGAHFVGDGCVPEHLESSETVYPYPGPRAAESAKRKDRPGDQKIPVPNDGPSMHDLVLEDLAGRSNSVRAGLLVDAVVQRKALGLSRYGTILQAFNDRDALRDALDEAVDLLVYLRQALVEAAAARDELQRYHLAGAYNEATSAALRLAWITSLRRPS